MSSRADTDTSPLTTVLTSADAIRIGDGTPDPGAEYG
jgi:hypothetical protein